LKYHADGRGARRQGRYCGARLLVDRDRAAAEIGRVVGTGKGEMSTEEILALTRR
jgi:hypothetical protein